MNFWFCRRRSPQPAPRVGGFTLIEILVVLVVLGILAAMAAPTFLQYLRKTQLNDAVDLVDSYLYRGFSESRSKRWEVGLQFDTNADSIGYVYCAADDGAGNADPTKPTHCATSTLLHEVTNTLGTFPNEEITAEGWHDGINWNTTATPAVHIMYDFPHADVKFYDGSMNEKTIPAVTLKLSTPNTDESQCLRVVKASGLIERTACPS